MKKILLFFTIFFLFPIFFLKLNAMELNQVIKKQILTIAQDPFRQNLNNKIVFGKMFEYPQALAKAYEDFISNTFKQEFDEYLSKIIGEKIATKEIDHWLNQSEIGSKFRKKIIEKTIKILVNAIKLNMDQKTAGDFAYFIKTYPQTSIVRTIANIFYYQLTEDLLLDDYKSSYFMSSKTGNYLSYAQMFSPKFELQLPSYLLEHLLELAPYSYDEKPINILLLNSNYLENIPETIGCLTNLQEIYLEHNKLKTLPQSILKLPKLKKIKIDKELFEQLPSEFKSVLKAKNIKIELAWG